LLLNLKNWKKTACSPLRQNLEPTFKWWNCRIRASR
jgi:hypothetical protein